MQFVTEISFTGSGHKFQTPRRLHEIFEELKLKTSKTLEQKLTASIQNQDQNTQQVKKKIFF